MSSQQPLLLLAPRITDDSKAIWKAALDMNWSTQRIRSWRVPESLTKTNLRVVIYGEPLFAEAVADQMNLVLLEPAMDWLTRVPRHYLHRDIQIMSLAQARNQTSPAFVKPADGKIFDPKVYTSGADLPGEETVDSDIPVLRSGIVDFRLEVRCFVHARRIVTLSPYWRDDRLALNNEGLWAWDGSEESAARGFAETVLQDQCVSLPPACTLDIGRLPCGNWAIIETNPCWGAGLYGCDPQGVLLSLQHTVVPRASLSDDQRPWVSARRQGQISS